VDITEDRKAGVIILGVMGRLDTTTSKSFEERILATIDAGEKQIVIDFSQLDYISSSGLRVLILAAKRLSSVSGKIVLCCLKDYIMQVFEIAGFSSIFSIYNSQEEAINNL